MLQHGKIFYTTISFLLCDGLRRITYVCDGQMSKALDKWFTALHQLNINYKCYK